MIAFAKTFCTLLTAGVFAGALAAQERQPPPPPSYMELQLWNTVTGLEVGFDKSFAGLMVVAASTNPATATIRADLPPVLIEMQVIDFFLLDGNHRYVLRPWHKDYFAQFGLLDLESSAIGISHVLTVPSKPPVVDSDATR